MDSEGVGAGATSRTIRKKVGSPHLLDNPDLLCPLPFRHYHQSTTFQETCQHPSFDVGRIPCARLRERCFGVCLGLEKANPGYRPRRTATSTICRNKNSKSIVAIPPDLALLFVSGSDLALMWCRTLSFRCVIEEAFRSIGHRPECQPSPSVMKLAIHETIADATNLRP